MQVSEETREKRRKQTAEVFTPPELVQEILDNLSPEVWAVGKTFCDPAAGNGNFLVAVYRRKVEVHGHDPQQALEAIYGVELMQDNTDEMRSRLISIAVGYGVNEQAATDIVNKNIVCHNALTYDFNFGEKPKFVFGV